MPAPDGLGPDVPQAGPVTAFEALFGQHSRALLAYALRRADGRDEAVDVVSETMLVAWRRWKEVPDGAEARPWLFGVARKVLANKTRSTNRRNRLGAKLKEKLGEIVIEDHADDVATALVVRTALRRLSEEDREILALTAWEGLTPTEVAVALSIPAATIRSRLHRARSRLRSELESTGWKSERNSSTGHEADDEQILARRMEEQT